MYKKYKGEVPTDARKLASQQTGLTQKQITRSIALIKKKKEDEENYRMQSYPVSTALFQVIGKDGEKIPTIPLIFKIDRCGKNDKVRLDNPEPFDCHSTRR